MIIEKIMRHLDLLGLLINSTQAMISSCENGKFDIVDNIADNRERLINIIKLLQDDIESQLQSTKQHFNSDEMDIFKAWIEDVTNLVAENQKLDDECLELLDRAKNSTTEEIATVFKKKKQFQGYNLNNVKTR